MKVVKLLLLIVLLAALAACGSQSAPEPGSEAPPALTPAVTTPRLTVKPKSLRRKKRTPNR